MSFVQHQSGLPREVTFGYRFNAIVTGVSRTDARIPTFEADPVNRDLVVFTKRFLIREMQLLMRLGDRQERKPY